MYACHCADVWLLSFLGPVFLLYKLFLLFLSIKVSMGSELTRSLLIFDMGCRAFGACSSFFELAPGGTVLFLTEEYSLSLFCWVFFLCRSLLAFLGHQFFGSRWWWRRSPPSSCFCATLPPFAHKSVRCSPLRFKFSALLGFLVALIISFPR